ncbi:endoglin [Egretta garzetta]|uniref:endoglin n=1 Tax=Egretta garzetta TaxID=188379 RepID=UPI00163BC12F|nr:endoglin [Egretta garzetta]
MLSAVWPLHQGEEAPDNMWACGSVTGGGCAVTPPPRHQSETGPRDASLVFPPDPGRAEGCDLQLLSTEAPITLSYATSTVPRGCVSSGSMDTGHEVHILSVEWSKVSAFPLNVSVVPPAHGCTRSPVLILLCARCSATVTSPCSNLLVRTDAHLGPGTTAALGPELPMATSQGQLLTWAEEFYGGITSYSELRDPRWVQLLLGEDASSPQGCILQEHFDARLHLEAEVIFYGVKGCSRGHPSTSATHIIHLQPEPSSTITEVNVSLNCPESPASKQFLILQSRANLTWFISVSNCHIQFLASGNYKFASVPWVLIAGERLPDTEQGLVAKAFEKNWSFIASYSAIPTSARISLELQEHHATTRAPVTSIPLGPTAEEFYGGITSYSELRDPRWVQLLLGEDASSPQGCILQEHFDARLHLEAEVIFYGVKGCSRGHPSTSATHIIHLQPEPSSTITEVNVSLNCPESPASKQFLILQSRANLTWFISVSNCHIQFLASGNYKFASVPWVLIAGERLPDTEQGLVAKAFEKNWSFIASYSAIPTSARISLELQEHHATTRAPVTSIPLGPTADVLPHKLLHTLQPWKCTDETMEIVIARSHLEPIKDVVNITLRDISCQAEKNATHFMLKTPLSHCGTSLEGRGHANNELILSLAKGAVLQSVRVAFQCNIPSELFLRLFPTAAFEAPQTELEVNKEAFVQVSTQWPFTHAIPEGGRVPFSATLKCKAGLQNTTIFEGVLEVTVKDGWWPPNNRGLGLAAVLGITFGAFLIGALLTAGLWCIYSRTRPTSKLQPLPIQVTNSH